MVREGYWSFGKHFTISSILLVVSIILVLFLSTKESVSVVVIGGGSNYTLFSGNPRHAIYVIGCFAAYIVLLLLHKPIKSAVEKKNTLG